MLPYRVHAELCKATLLQYFGPLCHNVFATEAENLLNAVWHNSRAKYFEFGSHKAILNCLGFYKQVTYCHSEDCNLFS